MFKFFFILSLIISLIISLDLSADEKQYLNFIFLAGYSSIDGYYKNKIDPGLYFGFNFQYPLKNYLFLDSTLSYSRYVLTHSKSSELISFSFSAGPLIKSTYFEYFNPFMAISGGLSYLDLTSDNLNSHEKTYKPALFIKTGFFIPLKKILTDLHVEYSINELSDKSFKTIKYIFGVGYRFSLYDDKKITEISEAYEIDKIYFNAVQYFKAGDGLNAKKIFLKVKEYNSNYKDVKSYLNIILNSELKYEKGKELITNGNNIDALSYLMESSEHIKAAKKDYIDLKSSLKSKIPLLEKKAVDEYNKNHFKEAISILRKIKLIDPVNKIVLLYLPKAEKRYKALKLFSE